MSAIAGLMSWFGICVVSSRIILWTLHSILYLTDVGCLDVPQISCRMEKARLGSKQASVHDTLPALRRMVCDDFLYRHLHLQRIFRVSERLLGYCEFCDKLSPCDDSAARFPHCFGSHAIEDHQTRGYGLRHGVSRDRGGYLRGTTLQELVGINLEKAGETSWSCSHHLTDCIQKF